MAEHEQIDFETELRRYARAEPFMPFDIVVTSGDRYEVTGRHQVAVGKAVVIILPPDSTSIYLRTNQLVAVELAAPAA